jgi:mxaJ protein
MQARSAKQRNDSSVRRACALLLALGLAMSFMAAHAPLQAARVSEPLRVCSDPNNLPFSNQQGEGLENKLAELLARELGAPLEYTWWAQRRGFIRNTLAAGRCDVVMGVPKELELALTTQPYYRSSYVFVAPKTLQPPLQSLDDPRLRTLRIGVPLVGDDGANPPPAQALAQRGVIENVIGYSVLGNYAEPNPPARLIEAVGRGELDVAIAWGPLAGYFAQQQRAPLRILPVQPSHDAGVPFVFDIALGVRRGDDALRERLDHALLKHRRELLQLLAAYGFPQARDS